MLDHFDYPGLDKHQLDQFKRWAHLLQEENQKVNLTRISSLRDIYVRHFTDSLQILAILDQHDDPKTLLDVGSGAGFPGLALALARPDWQILSVEATGKKIRFQQQVIETLGLVNAVVRQGRAEVMGKELAFRAKFNVVTARAVARLNLLVELCLPLVRVGGVMVALKGPDIEEELNQVQSALQILGGVIEEIEPYHLRDPASSDASQADAAQACFHRIVVRKEKDTPRSYPRMYGVMQKRPL